MLITSKAIILNHFKYGETSIICNCYTQKEGYLSFLVKGAFGKNKKRAVYHPLNLVEIVFKQNSNHQALHFFSSIETVFQYNSVYDNPIKTSMVFFLTELLQICLKNDGQQNTELFDVLEKTLIDFDQKKDNFSEFHLYLVVQLIQQMGISPDLTHTDYPYFDLQNGKFCLTLEKSSQMLGDIEKDLFVKIFQLKFSEISKNQLNNGERKMALHLLMRYLELHIDNFKTPNSLEILKQL